MRKPTTIRINLFALALALAVAAGWSAAAPTPTLGQAVVVEGDTVRDRLWIFTCAANSDFAHIGRRSVMTPAEGAFYLGVPNIIVVQSSETEAPHGRLQPPFAQYAVAMHPLKRMVWSVVGSGGFHSPKETKEVLRFAKMSPNFAGVMLDDFFFRKQQQGRWARLSVEELADIRRQLNESGRPMEIFATVYADQLELPIADYLKLIDVVTLWTWKPEDLKDLEANLKKAESTAPKAKKMLGCYVVDYSRKQGVPVESMKLQCETGLRWLKEGRIDGIIFLGNTTMDLGFESVEWTRRWIQQVGDSKLR